MASNQPPAKLTDNGPLSQVATADTYSSDLDVIIVNYNTAALLRQCLQSVFASRCNFRWRVFVVDNGSKDDSVQMVRTEFEPFQSNLIFVASPVNQGFAFGNNLALRQICRRTQPEFQGGHLDTGRLDRQLLYMGSESQARYILLLNPDTVVEPDCFQISYDFMESHLEAGVMGAKLLRANGQLDLACRRSFPTPEVSFYRMTGLSKMFPQHPRFARYNLTYLNVDKLYEVDSVCGAFMLVRGKAIEQAGLLDEAYFMYGEDLDWAYRIKQHGWQVFYNPATTVTHYKGESSKQRSTGAIINFYDAMLIFYRKHYARQTFFLFNWLIYTGILFKGALALFRNALRPKDRKKVS